MTPAEMLSRCQMAIDFYEEGGLDGAHASVTLVFPKGWKAPPGFPRRTLACENPQGTRTYHVNAMKLRTWVSKAICEMDMPTGVQK